MHKEWNECIDSHEFKISEDESQMLQEIAAESLEVRNYLECSSYLDGFIDGLNNLLSDEESSQASSSSDEESSNLDDLEIQGRESSKGKRAASGVLEGEPSTKSKI